MDHLSLRQSVSVILYMYNEQEQSMALACYFATILDC
uniref:Uncharacterized protein n=1 Tax=Arundo donax TaxID=35708 RepID=A0A0A8ZQ70_ARUDO